MQAEKNHVNLVNPVGKGRIFGGFVKNPRSRLANPEE
jgi:hypothetical protein